MNPYRCPFERAIISTRFSCSLAEKFSYAEREGVQCTDTHALMNCKALLNHLRENSRFSIRHMDDKIPLSHGQDMKVKCGGLLGLQALLQAEAADGNVEDIHALVQLARDKYSSIAELPYQSIVPHITSYKLR